MSKACFGPMEDWRTFTLRTEGKGLREFKADWYRLFRKEGVCSDMIVCFKNGDVRLLSSNIYWVNANKPENYKFFINGQPVAQLFSRIESVDMMHPLFNHPECAEFWCKDADGAYSSFDFGNAKTTMNRLMMDLIQGAPNDRARPALDNVIANADKLRTVRENSRFTEAIVR